MRMMKLLAVTSVLALCAPAHAESLNEALAKAYSTNPDLAAARATLRATDEQAPQAMVGFRPQISADASIARTNEDSATASDDYTSRTASLSLQQPIFRGGRTMAAVRAADSAIAAQRARLLDTEQTVLLSGIESYLNVQRDMAVLDLNVNNEAVLTRQLRAARDRFNVGEVTKTDVSQAEARLAGATAARVQAEGNLVSSKAAYQRVFGEAPADLQKPDSSTLQLPATIDELVSAAETSNPSVIAAANTRLAADAVLDGTKGERLPTLTAEGSLARSYDAGSSAANRQDNATIGLSLNMPLYTGGSTSSRIREARQNVARRANELDSANRAATAIATQSWEQYQTAQATLKSRESQVAVARIALDGVQQEASVGNRTVLDTLDAEQELLDARVGQVRAEHDQILAKYQILAAAGRLTAKDLQLAVEYYDETSYSNRVRNQWIGSGE